jgi:hypothetical protein
MKKLLLALIVIFVTGVSLSAWEPADLTKFPLGQDGKSWILNLGVGLSTSSHEKPSYADDFVSIPPLRLSLDKNVGMGDKKLPFFIGGILGYTGWGWKVYDKKYFYHNISLGGRFGYHFNWNVKNLDTYAVTTTGYTFFMDKTGFYKGEVLWGVNIGTRYFVNNWFGFWVETGYTGFSWFDIGLAFKF